MYLNLDKKTKYNYYMRYASGECVVSLYNELKEFDNFKLFTLDSFINSLNYWGSHPEFERWGLGDSWLKNQVSSMNKRIEKKLKREAQKLMKKKIAALKKLENKIIQEFEIWKEDNAGYNENWNRYMFIYAMHKNYKMTQEEMINFMTVKRSTYFEWKTKGMKLHKKYDKALLEKVQYIFYDVFRTKKGLDFIFDEMRDPESIHYEKGLTRHKLYKHYKYLGRICTTKKFKVKKPTEKKKISSKYSNILGYDFDADKPNEKWWMDESYLRLPSGKWVYLCAIIDSYNNEIISFDIRDYRDSELANDVLEHAIRTRENIRDVILTTDNASIYKAKEFEKICIKNGIQQSMTDPGNSCHNRPIEYFFFVFKSEYFSMLENLKNWDLNELKELSKSWIHHYNYKRKQKFTVGQWVNEEWTRVFIERSTPMSFGH